MDEPSSFFSAETLYFSKVVYRLENTVMDNMMARCYQLILCLKLLARGESRIPPVGGIMDERSRSQHSPVRIALCSTH